MMYRPVKQTLSAANAQQQAEVPAPAAAAVAAASSSISSDDDDKRVPQYKILLNGSELKPEVFSVRSIRVQLSASSRANTCELSFACRFDHKNSKIEDDMLKKLQPGAKIKIKMGYKIPQEVFMGYIYSCYVEYGAGGVFLQVACMDARGMLMGNTSWETFENESKAQIVKKILDSVSSYCDGVSVTLPGAADKENPETLKKQDYYRYVCSLARLTGSSFCMPRTKLIFGKNIYASATVKRTYKWGKDLLSFSRNADISEQLGSVTVSGVQPDTLKEFTATAKPDGRKTGASVSTGVKKKEQEIESALVKTQAEAKNYAESLMRERSMKLIQGRAQVIGDEKIEPGTKVKFEGLDPTLNGEYFVTGVTHTFSTNGYLTDIMFGRNSL